MPLLQGGIGVWVLSRLFKYNLLLSVGLFAYANFLYKLPYATTFGVTVSQKIIRGSAATCALYRSYHTTVDGSRKCVPSNEMSCDFNYHLFR